MNKILSKIILTAFLFAYCSICRAQTVYEKDIRHGSQQTERYLPILEHQNVALCVNQTSMVGQRHLLDTLLSLGVNVKKIFCPEHGFRGDAEAGKHISNQIDTKTGLPIISLYGNNKKPTKEQLQDIDIIIFDIQDVGARFYTYISTLTLLMEAAAENDKVVLVFDRPNPNGYWVDGCILQSEFQSFVGMHSVPINHGMTIAEYARMVNGEHWLKNNLTCKLLWVKVQGYNHAMRYQLPISPSPNLSSMEAIYLYPTLCLFEGTPMSIGRGTNAPFCLLGYPDFGAKDTVFVPQNIVGVATNPPCLGKQCNGYNLKQWAHDTLINKNRIDIDLLINAYNSFDEKDKFFTPFFNKLAGNATLAQQIKDGKNASQIRQSWQSELQDFKKIRKKYLLYKDFQ